MLAIWSPVPLPFLKPAWIFGSSRFTSCSENFERYFTNVWDESNCAVVWAFLGIFFLCDWNEIWPFPVLWALLSFPNWLAYWVQDFQSIIFQDLIWPFWTSITSTSLFVVMLRPTWLHIQGFQALGEWSHHRDFLSPEDPFGPLFSVYSCHLFLISSASVRSIAFLSLSSPSLHEMFPCYH